MAYWINNKLPISSRGTNYQDTTLEDYLPYQLRIRTPQEVQQRLQPPTPLPVSAPPLVAPPPIAPPPIAPPPIAPPPITPPPVIPPLAGPPRTSLSRSVGDFRPRSPTAGLAIPSDISREAKIAGFLAQLSNFGSTLGRTPRGGFDPTAPLRAEQAVRQQWIDEQRAMDTLRQSNKTQGLTPMQALELKDAQDERDPNSSISRNMRKYLTDKGLAGLENASYNDMKKDPRLLDLKAIDPKSKLELQKLEAETKLANIKTMEAESQEAGKGEIVQMINTAMGKEVATSVMDFKTLTDMASDIGLDPLKLRRAKAAGGISGQAAVYDIEKQPELSSLMRSSATRQVRFLSDPQEKELYTKILDSDLSPKQKQQALEPLNKEIQYTRQKADAYAEKVLNNINDPKVAFIDLFSAIDYAKNILNKYETFDGWNTLSSTIRSAGGRLGKFAFDASSVADPPTKELIMAIERVSDTFGRMKTGANMPVKEAESFERQLGAASFSNPTTLRMGLNSAEKILRQSVKKTWDTVDPRVRPDYEDRIKQFLPKQYKTSQEAWDAED